MLAGLGYAGFFSEVNKRNKLSFSEMILQPTEFLSKLVLCYQHCLPPSFSGSKFQVQAILKRAPSTVAMPCLLSTIEQH